MIAKAALVLLSLAASAAAVLAYPAPSADELEQLRHQHHRKDWLRVTTDSMRYEVRVRGIDDAGLSGLTPRPHAPAPPDPLPWSAIARIDRRTSGFRGGQITGAILGGLSGFIAAHLVGLVEKHGEFGVFTGLTVGAVAGGWIGGRRGDRRVREHPFYAAPPQPAPIAAEAAAPFESLAVDTVAALVVTPPPSAIAASPAVLNACNKLHPEDLLRVEADFGKVEGYASSIEPGGIEGLRADLGHESTAAPPPLLTWDRVHRVDRRGNSAGLYARRGGLALGVLCGVAGLAATGALGGNDSETMGGGLAGAAIGCAVGAVGGGLIGMGVPRWHPIY